MTWTPPNRAPEGCREPRCAHFVEIKSKAGDCDRCAIGRPMHEPCAWKETPEDLRVRAEREGRL